mmetsp:Transcript_7361/g.20790  ORF Transcript_7361/g.20790 Transcript_7361/m.20790 type:complete len:207 (-) Transcript_7361:60-680(-)
MNRGLQHRISASNPPCLAGERALLEAVVDMASKPARPYPRLGATWAGSSRGLCAPASYIANREIFLVVLLAEGLKLLLGGPNHLVFPVLRNDVLEHQTVNRVAGENLEGRHGTDRADTGHLVSLIHVNLHKHKVRVLLAELHKGGANHLARATPCGSKVHNHVLPGGGGQESYEVILALHLLYSGCAAHGVRMVGYGLIGVRAVER